MRPSRHILGWLAALSLAVATPLAAAPQRVVSMNLCADQLAMLLAGDGQLISVSDLAQDPRISAMAETAAGYPVNHGRAEEIYLLRPDLVIAGQFTSGPAVQMLRRLGIRVEILPPAESIAAIRQEITRMGGLLGREEAAADLIAEFDRGLASLGRDRRRGRAALYYANGMTSGRNTLAGTILDAAGYENIAGDYGIAMTAGLPLELVVMAQPDRLITGAKWPGQSRSEAILDHPALKKLTPETAEVADRDWVCGTPFILRAIEALQ
ncbi:ABC transporter substrate-binding protein [Paracoccus methylarcula]|uniref:ABC transporter substrate-binding protein n=1 Tax=Paracoccus methylarcula TaxID=72022 RepID=UPI001FE9D35C|nr:ABC transporter substrate-binding protein [Paracoccus methylarcula]